MTNRKTTTKEGPEETSRLQYLGLLSGPTAALSSKGYIRPPTSHQPDLKKVMRAELGDQTWQFPLDRVARMLSPKKRIAPLDDKVIDHLGNYACVSDSPGFMKKLKNAVMKLGPRLKDIQWPSGPDERPFYTPLAQFLNACVSVCKEELTNDDRYTKGPFHDLEFIVYDKETQDSVDGASPVKPDLVGGKKFMAFADSDDCKVKSARLYWNPPDKNMSPILLPVEVKDNWIELYSLVLGYNHKEGTFRFLIFHRGGLSASLPLDLRDEDSHKSLLHVFLSLLSCSHARDAGIAAWCNERQFKLPVDNSDKPDYVDANVDEILHDAVLHAMLGWLAICQEELQHRDVSVGNVLRLENPVEMPSFKFKSDIADLIGTLSLSETLPSTVTEQIARLESSLAELKVNTRCLGFIIDGDMAVDWKTYFDANHDGTRSGTFEFMSDKLRESLYLPRTYIQSTVDDLASFYYVGQWAAVFNPSHQSDMLEQLRNHVAGPLAWRSFATSRIINLSPKTPSHRQDYGLFLQCCQPILKEWHDSIDSLDRRFVEVTDELTAHFDGKIDSNTYRSLFLSFSYHGVADFAQILERHGASLASYDKLDS
ncbi:hypothetical protein HHX47_DHR2001127 [Lentinula edodes]|nr:hypothetical protein HHX47_DHR2001127 [Lentinula edodes]